MSSRTCLALASAVLIALTATSDLRAEISLDKLDRNLVRLEDGKLKKAKNVSLASKKYVAFYYSAHWCPPCRAFTPKLVDFYQKMKASHGDAFELVFVSSDRSESAMQEYMEWGKMPWPAVEFKSATDKDLSAMAARVIPYMVVVDSTGKEVLGKGEGDWVHPSDLLGHLASLLKK